MKKVCIVPFTAWEIPLIPLLKKSYAISALVTPMGIGVEGEDISSLHNLHPTGLKFTNDVETGIMEADLVLISQIPGELQTLRDYAMRALCFAVKQRKDVHCFLELTDDEKLMINSERRKSECNISFYPRVKKAQSMQDFNFWLEKFDVPVFYVCEEVPDCDGYEVFLSLAEEFSRNGKTVLAISEETYNDFLGYDCFDFSADLQVKKQIFRFNSFVYERYRKIHPDVIFIKLPFPLMRFDEDNLFDCGATAYIAAQAVPGDGCIYCTHADVNGGMYWTLFSERIQAKLGYPLLCVHISNRAIDNAGDTKLSSLRLPEEHIMLKIEELFSDSDFCFFHLLADKDLDSFYHKINDDFFKLPYGVI